MDENEERVEQADSEIHLFGRRKIYTPVEEITAENVVAEVNKALTAHMQNLQEEEYLYWYRRGVQPILQRKKEVRPEINNKVLINNAAFVTTFKNGYFLTKPTAYVARVDDPSVTEKVSQLNEIMFAAGKQHADNDVVDWFHTVGLGVMYVEPNREGRKRRPLNVYALDPRTAFCVYSLKPGNRTVMGIHMVVADGKLLFDVFTDSAVFRLSGGYSSSVMGDKEQFPMTGTVTRIDGMAANRVGLVPLIEYQMNASRMGCFECAIPIMDAINTIESNRADGVEQAIQQLCVAYNCQFEEGTTANTIRQAGMIALKSVGDNKADFKILDSTLSQTDTQTAIDSLYEQMLEKCGVPSSVRDGGSTSDNVGAVYLRSGWAAADTDARNTEDFFRESNERFTAVALKILEQGHSLNDLEPEDFDLCFYRNDQNNILAKTQAALNLKSLGFAPEIAFERSGLSNDPVTDVEKSRKYIDAVWQTGVSADAEGDTVGRADGHQGEDNRDGAVGNDTGAETQGMRGISA